MDDTTYARGSKSFCIRLSAVTYDALQRQVSATEIPGRFGTAWYVRRLMEAIPMPDPTPPIIARVDDQLMADIMHLTTRTNDHVVCPLHHGSDYVALAHMAHELPITIGNFMARLITDGPTEEGGHERPLSPGPAIDQAGVLQNTQRLEDVAHAPLVHKITINVSRPFYDMVQEKALRYGGGRRGMISTLVRRALLGQAMPIPQRAAHAAQDMQAARYIGTLRGLVTQMITHCPNEDSGQQWRVRLDAARHGIDAIRDYLLSIRPLALQDRPVLQLALQEH